MPNFKVSNPPNTLIATSHGIQIVAKGKVVGAIVKWAIDPYTRSFTKVYELNYASSGHPIDLVPGNLDGFKISVSRYDIWKRKFEEAFVNASIEEALGLQDTPFEVNQYLLRPDGEKELVVYRGAWLSKVGRTYDSTADRIIKVDGEITFLRREKIL